MNNAFRAWRGTPQSFALDLDEEKRRGGNAGEGGIKLLELLCKVQFEALGILV